MNINPEEFINNLQGLVFMLMSKFNAKNKITIKQRESPLAIKVTFVNKHKDLFQLIEKAA